MTTHPNPPHTRALLFRFSNLARAAVGMTYCPTLRLAGKALSGNDHSLSTPLIGNVLSHSLCVKYIITDSCFDNCRVLQEIAPYPVTNCHYKCHRLDRAERILLQHSPVIVR